MEVGTDGQTQIHRARTKRESKKAFCYNWAIKILRPNDFKREKHSVDFHVSSFILNNSLKITDNTTSILVSHLIWIFPNIGNIH